MTKRPAFWIPLAGVFLLLAIGIAGTASIGLMSKPSSSSAGSTGRHGTGISRPPTTTTAAAPQTLMNVNGAGNQVLQPFTVPARANGWLIHYLYNCTNAGNFQIYLQDAFGDQNLAVQGGTAGPAISGSTYYNDAPGTYSLSIDSTCSWTVVAQTMAPTTTTTAVPQTLLSVNGTGIQSLPQFTVQATAKGWLIHYEYNSAGGNGFFQINVENATGLNSNQAVNELQDSGKSTYDNYSPGTYSLDINSPPACSWTVVVQAIPS